MCWRRSPLQSSSCSRISPENATRYSAAEARPRRKNVRLSVIPESRCNRSDFKVLKYSLTD